LAGEARRQAPLSRRSRLHDVIRYQVSAIRVIRGHFGRSLDLRNPRPLDVVVDPRHPRLVKGR